MSTATSAVAISGLSKHFGGFAALKDVSLSIRGGDVHALLGQNGSGKSTLVKIITGVYDADPGAQLSIWGTPVTLPLHAPHTHGVAVIHQDLGLVDAMTVLENLGITSAYGARPLGPIRLRGERRRCQSLLDDIELDVELDTLIGELRPAARAGVAIARARRVLEEHADRFVFILDEPTVYLDDRDAARVASLMRRVADDGSAVIFISHRLPEVVEVADRMTILRDGEVADTFSRGQGDQPRIVAAMLGRSLDRYYPARVAPAAEPALLRARDLSGRQIQGVSFELAPGEIVGLAGIPGTGFDEIPYMLAGATQATGSADLDGTELLSLSPLQRIRAGVALVPGNRHRDGVWLGGSAQENVTLPSLALGNPWRPIRPRAERAAAAKEMVRYGVKPPIPTRPAGQYSGGNQQKLVLAKWLTLNPRLVLLDEPTQGIDAGARFELLGLIAETAAAGASVLVCSGDYEQLAGICHRVLIIANGRVTRELSRGDLTESRVAAAAQSSPSRS